jgi:hypothetical protein
MNYTEEQYSELYNNLPKGLRDLVLSGDLSNRVGAIAMKYGLTPEETSELEPAVEDVALGLVTIEELPENIFVQVGIDNERAQQIAREAMQTILQDYLDELRLTRKYKIELDARIRQEENKVVASQEAAAGEQGEEKANLAGNIINITRKNESPVDITQQNTPDQKVADWFSGGPSASKPRSRVELDSLGEDFATQPSVRTVPITNNKPIAEVKAQPVEDFTAPAPIQNTVVPNQIQNNSKKTAWDSIISDKPNNLKPVVEQVASPSKNITPNTQGQSKDLERSMVQVEQQILTLTQAVNRMIDRNDKTIAPVVQSVFNSGQYEEISRRLDAMSHRMDDLQSKFLATQSVAVKSEPTIAQSNPTAGFNKIFNIKKEEGSVEVAPERKIPIKPTTPDIKLSTPAKSAPEARSTTSTMSASILDSILEDIKTKPHTEDAPATTTPKPVVAEAPVVNKININNLSANSAWSSKAPPEPVKESAPANPSRDSLLRDLDFLKSSLSTNTPTNVSSPEPIIDPVSTDLNNLAQSTISDLKEEISPSTEQDKMKTLQDKIRALNKGIGSGGVASLGSNDPYRP